MTVPEPHPIRHPDKRKPTRAQLAHLKSAKEALLQLHLTIYGREYMSLHVPEDWQSLEEVFRCTPAKQKITLRLDEAVVKFFRKKGRGYQELINQVLRSYVELRLAKILEGPEDVGPNGEVL
ncbi:BrnA antitoxin family protein [Profundibacter amoris]|uniref:3-oxoacyl-ACP synthase n=1 Tax=Profundibacter amoris TaxID=2171755 RepID=A0A347UDQ2_9RHOB|nr:BrnA antitoxin family protein [Profundibacter amoris]AXX96980.1 hypothetical protein BAR1_02965 [Profundibacter amoris]